jgi:hypothetical protein
MGKAKASWSQVKAQIKHWGNAQLTGLIQDLFDRVHDRSCAGGLADKEGRTRWVRRSRA